MGTKAAKREAVNTGPYKDFGLWMKSLRKKLKLSQEAAERKAKSKDVTQAKLTHASRGSYCGVAGVLTNRRLNHD